MHQSAINSRSSPATTDSTDFLFLKVFVLTLPLVLSPSPSVIHHAPLLHHSSLPVVAVASALSTTRVAAKTSAATPAACNKNKSADMDWLYGIFGVCSSRGSKPPPPAADIEKDSSAYKGPCAQDDDLADDLMAPGRLYNLCKAKEAPPIDLVQQLISDPTRKSERISYKSPKDNECVCCACACLFISRVSSFKQTPLHAASGNGHEAVVRVLLDAGADFKARDK
jgi:hypothetical protein